MASPLSFRQLFDRESCTYTYVLAGPDRSAVIIDPVLEHAERDARILEELGLELRWILDTHVHADHITGARALQRRFGVPRAISRASGAAADRLLEDGDQLEFGARSLEVRLTPGHTAGDVTYVLDDQSCAFTGDALLVRGCGRTDFQEGDSHRLFHSVRERILSLPADTRLYPAHDYLGRTVTTVKEERAFNPRVGDGHSLEEFVHLMANLGLARPAKIDVAVPANLEGGL
jgi:glyoxylase-like metal-dependent hydrolase (beta-lactamase superfamily II)